jgi:ankyrin repeat protein
MYSWKKLFEQVNENGETPLLIAVKLNEWKLIECILKSRSDLAKQKDQNGNNLFHLLANLSEDKGAETIKNVLAILPNELNMDLLKEQNQTNEKPMDIAQFHNNTSSLKFLINIDNHSE